MIVVTGGAGFIGSNLIRALNLSGCDDILLIEDMSDGRKCVNLSGACVSDYLDNQVCAELLDRGAELGANIEMVYHLGACTDTTQWDGRLMMRENFAFSRLLCEYCIAREIPFVYASSAAVFGTERNFSERRADAVGR